MGIRVLSSTPEPEPVLFQTDETMRQAIRRFQVRMTTANERFLQDRINEIERKGLATEKAKFDYLIGKYRIHNLVWGDENDGENPTPLREHDVVIPANTLFKDIDMSMIEKGLISDAPVHGVIYPPLLKTDQMRQVFLDTVQRLCQSQSGYCPVCKRAGCECHKGDKNEDGDDDNEGVKPPIPPCTELALFLKHARGVEDVDFRYSYIPPFIPGDGHLSTYWVHGENPNEEANRLQERLEWYLEQPSLDVETDAFGAFEVLQFLLDEDLEVRAGFATGITYREEWGHPMWCSAYVYCRKSPDSGEVSCEGDTIPDAPNIANWGWRVVIYNGDMSSARPSAPAATVINGRKARFDSVLEFLDWYASWPEYLTERQLRSL
ncbi:Uncharacterized protein PECH_002312 [Penicillium ucsense]|uniref:Uncharacterized protein n=1 Tax=Penicillium ucsense TaxID=2839758 RepID=A0A8J8VWX5_9EURO|nr:Uncharacterized protein PECM_001901 [Penicillium ucsense]KAF7731060.1 Uncharacterized protein PECH_002312 [Penicillium ucsense]